MISQVLLYVCFSILAGGFLLLLIPSTYRPEVKIPTDYLLISAILVPILAFMPVLDIILFIVPRLGFAEALQTVLLSYTVGNAWNFTLMVSALLVLVIALMRSKEQRISASIALFLTFALILTIAWSSHAGAMDPIKGITGHFIHIAAISIWVGVILIVGWFATNHDNWLKFLSWFSKVAISCLAAAALSGILLMDVMVDGYTDSWMVSYGQGLLIKHLFLIPLVFYALLNGFVVKYFLAKDTAFNPIPWIRLEGIVLFVIFAVTAFFTQQSPPHGNYLTEDALSPVFQLFHNSIIDSSSTVGLTINLDIVYFFFIALLLVGLILLSIYKKASILVTFFISCLLVVNVYMMLMISVVVR